MQVERETYELRKKGRHCVANFNRCELIKHTLKTTFQKKIQLVSMKYDIIEEPHGMRAYRVFYDVSSTGYLLRPICPRNTIRITYRA